MPPSPAKPKDLPKEFSVYGGFLDQPVRAAGYTEVDAALEALKLRARKVAVEALRTSKGMEALPDPAAPAGGAGPSRRSPRPISAPVARLQSVPGAAGIGTLLGSCAPANASSSAPRPASAMISASPNGASSVRGRLDAVRRAQSRRAIRAYEEAEAAREAARDRIESSRAAARARFQDQNRKWAERRQHAAASSLHSYETRTDAKRAELAEREARLAAHVAGLGEANAERSEAHAERVRGALMRRDGDERERNSLLQSKLDAAAERHAMHKASVALHARQVAEQVAARERAARIGRRKLNRARRAQRESLLAAIDRKEEQVAAVLEQQRQLQLERRLEAQRKSGAIHGTTTSAAGTLTSAAGSTVREVALRTGLEKRGKRCGLCEREFDSLSGVSHYARVAEVRRGFGDASLCSTARYKSRSTRYEPVHLCVFCTQFF